MTRNFNSLLAETQAVKKHLCVGLDPDFEKIPVHLRRLGVREGLLAFNRGIVDATKEIAGSYKPNTAFFEAYGSEGWDVAKETIRYIREHAPEAVVIADAKRADIGNTNNGYIEAIFGDLEADAITVHPYLGSEALRPFLDRSDKGVFILCRTSNPGASEIQDLDVGGEPLYLHIARLVNDAWNTNGNCGLVTGATYPEEIQRVRSVAPSLPLLIPGIGAQGGDLEATVHAARGGRMLISASRSIMYASAGEDFAEAAERSAQELHRSITKAAVV